MVRVETQKLQREKIMKKPIADPSDVDVSFLQFVERVRNELKRQKKLKEKLKKSERPLNKKPPYTLSKIAQDRIMPEDLE